LGDATVAWSPSDAPRTVGRFKLIDLVGKGTFGSVYKAEDPTLGRTVAIKLPRAGNLPGSDDSGRFLREARSVSQLRHPSIVPVFEIGQDSGLPYLVSEFIQGITLADLLSSERLSYRAAADLVAEIADALHYAHQQGVTHRDVKPSNIMLERKSGVERSTDPDVLLYTPRLMDFGLAKRDSGDATMTVEGQVLGTPAYMSPEQAGGMSHAVDGRSDIYSLGVILYQLLAGELPFKGNSRMLLHHVMHHEPRPLRQRDAAIPRDLETICHKAMAKEPERRYTTASEFADDLRRYLKREPIGARPVGWTEKWWNYCVRNPVLSGLIATVFTLIVILTLVLISAQPGGRGIGVDSITGRGEDTSADELLAVSEMLDRNDPAWRFEDLEAHRAVIPSEQNGAKQIALFRSKIAEVTQRPQSEGQWQRPEWSDRYVALSKLAANEPLSDEDAELFRAELTKLEEPLNIARSMIDFPRGRFSVAYTRDHVSVLLPDQSAALHLTSMLEVDAFVNLHDGNRTKAIDDCLAIFHCCGSFADEPISMTQVIRTAIFRRGGHLSERILAHTTCSDDELIAFQNQCAAANEIPIHLIMARGERAILHYFLGTMETGDISPQALQVFKVPSRDRLPSVAEIRRFHAWLLNHHTQWIQIASLPSERWLSDIAQLDREFDSAPAARSAIVESLRDLATKQQCAATALHHLADARTSLTAIAAERFRLAHQRWPESLQELVPDFLARIESDPYDGRPLRYQRVVDGVIVYSIGPDASDSDGRLASKTSLETGTDVGFRLWNEDQRLTALAKKKP
jgi:serine/threonine protein kinase